VENQISLADVAASGSKTGGSKTGPMAQALETVKKNDGMFRKEFYSWLETNWHIWERFEIEAEHVWNRGREHYSARTLIEFIRHETFIRESKTNFKVNNSYVPDIGRLYGLIHADRRGFFECRDMTDVCMRGKIRSTNAEMASSPA
jgi:hypothetical protein